MMIFGTLKQPCVKKNLVPGETKTKNVHSISYGNKTGMCISVFFLFDGQC